MKAVRQNGQILCSDVSNGEVYLFDPQHPQANLPVIASLPNGTSIAGIIEVEDDVFYAAATLGNVYSFSFKPNTTSIWQIDMRQYTQTGKAPLRKIIDVPEVLLFNGLTLLSQQHSTILGADVYAGRVWKLNVHTGAYEVVFDDPFLKGIPTAKPPFGVNGIRVINKQVSNGTRPTLYFSNTNHGYLGTVPISLDTGKPTGSAKLLTDKVPGADDFAVDSCGNIWLTENVQNTLVRVFPDGHVQTIAGAKNSTTLIGPVSARFGKGQNDRDTLYVSTDGLTLDSKGQPLTSNGKIATLDIRDL
ncbi:hypothetical protein RBB50_009290 [Rhinocladiella similis]